MIFLFLWLIVSAVAELPARRLSNSSSFFHFPFPFSCPTALNSGFLRLVIADSHEVLQFKNRQTNRLPEWLTISFVVVMDS